MTDYSTSVSSKTDRITSTSDAFTSNSGTYTSACGAFSSYSDAFTSASDAFTTDTSTHPKNSTWTGTTQYNPSTAYSPSLTTKNVIGKNLDYSLHGVFSNK